jgi:hypothetical protein
MRTVLVMLALAALLTTCFLAWLAALRRFSSSARDRRLHDLGVVLFAIAAFSGVIAAIVGIFAVLDALSVPRSEASPFFLIAFAPPAVTVVWLAYRQKRTGQRRRLTSG